MIWSPIVCSGESEVMGSWKIMAISLPRIERIRPPCGSTVVRSTISSSRRRKRIWPPSILLVRLGSSRRIEWAVTLLPQPLSPTSPSVSPRLMLRETPSMARTLPSSVRKPTRRFSISRMSSLCVEYLLAENRDREQSPSRTKPQNLRKEEKRLDFITETNYVGNV